MNANHLSNWDLEEYALGQRTPEVLQHLTQCPDCQAAATDWQDSLAMFRTAAVAWSEQSLQHRPARIPARANDRLKHIVPSPLRWALVAAALLLFTLLPIYFMHHGASPQVARTLPAGTSSTAAGKPAPISDEALLNQVDEEVSEAVPDSMEPLTHLVTTQANTSADTTGGSHHAQRN